MPILHIKNNYLLISENRNIIVCNLSDYSHEKNTLPDLVVEKKDQSSEPQISDEVNAEEPAVVESSEILDIVKSQNENVIAISTKMKEVVLYEFQTNKLELIAVKRVPRIPSAMQFSPDASVLLISDKTGDCYSFDCVNIATSEPKWILGHLSMLLDVIFTPDGRFVITCDRDEKIRVTRYPKTYIIENYCLGHTEFVSAIQLLPHSDLLVSLSGDLKLKLWKFMEGLETSQLELPSPGYKLYVQQFNSVSSIIAVVFYNFTQIQLYKVTDKFEILQDISFDKIIASATFGSNYEEFYVSLIDKSDTTTVVKYSASDNYATAIVDETLNKMLCDNVKNSLDSLTNEMTLMFKKKFDNIKDYQERKKRRMMEGKS